MLFFGGNLLQTLQNLGNVLLRFVIGHFKEGCFLNRLVVRALAPIKPLNGKFSIYQIFLARRYNDNMYVLM